MIHNESEIIDALDQAAGGSKDHPLQAVKIELLDMAALQERLGPRWEQSKRTVHLLIEGCLRRAVSHHDRWQRGNDDQYLLFLANTSETDAARRSRAIMQEIAVKLFGTGELDARPRLRADVLKLGHGALTGSAAARLAALARSDVSYSLLSDELTRSGAGPKAKIRVQKPERDELTIIAAADIDALVHQADKDTLPWRAEQAGMSPTTGDAKRTLQPSPGTLPNGMSYTFSYTPIWDIPKRALLCYRLNFVLHLPRSSPIDTASSHFIDQVDRPTIRAIDMLRVKRALSGLMRSFRGGRKYLLSIPVSAQSCNTRWGTPTIFDLFAGLPKEVAKLVILDLIDGGEGEYRHAIGEITASANQFCRQSLTRVDMGYDGGLLNGANARPAGYGVDMTDRHVDERTLMAFLDQIAVEAAAQDASTFIWGVDSRSVAMMAIAAGISYVSGSIVADDINDPDGISKLSLSEFFS
jgi:hypothetical protein